MLTKRTLNKKIKRSVILYKKIPFLHTYHSCGNENPSIHIEDFFSPGNDRTTQMEGSASQLDPFLYHQTAPSKQRLFWQKTQLLSFLLIFSAIMLCCTQNPYPYSPNQETLDQTIKHILDANASCSIPKSAQIIHLPQIHKYHPQLKYKLPAKVLNILYNTASHSQFLITHIISQNSSHIIFDEGSQFIVTENTKDNLLYTLTNENGIEQDIDLQDIADTFNHRLPLSYSRLNKEQIHLLHDLGAAPIALSLDHIKIIHRTQNPSEAERISQILTNMWDNQKELELESINLYERISIAQENNDKETLKKLQKEAKELSDQRMTLNEKEDQLIIDKREEILSREVHFFLENNPSQKVFIIYGAAHDLSDEFSADSFYTLPHHCSIPESFLKSHGYARYLNSWANRIYTENDILFPTHIQSMRILYRKSYTILTDIIEDHIDEGGRKEDPSISWNSELNRYLTYSELEFIAESISEQMVALEDIIQSSERMAYATNP